MATRQARDSTAAEIKPIPLDLRVTITAIVRAEPTGGYWVEVPALPGCYTRGETLEELPDLIRDAAEGWLAVRHEQELESKAALDAGAGRP